MFNLTLSPVCTPLSHPFSTVPRALLCPCHPYFLRLSTAFPLFSLSFLPLPALGSITPSSFHISGPLAAPPTTNTPTYDAPHSSFSPSFHLFAAIYFSRHLILPLFSSIYHYRPLFPCLHLISLSSLCSPPTVLSSVSPSSPLSVSSVCL